VTEVVLPEQQVERGVQGKKIVLIVMDGLGGLPHPASGLTELETARTPHLNALAARGSLGMTVIVKEGITPGSGPGHLSLFGYDPMRTVIGRGALSALGVGLELEPGDVAARLNLATFDGAGLVTDRRAGRPSDKDAERVVAKVQQGLEAPKGIEVTLVPEKEHRVVLHLRGKGLGGAALTDTDPLETGRAALPVRAEDDRSKPTAEIVTDVLAQSRKLLADEPKMNGFLARGFAAFERIPTLDERFGLKGLALAKYPMYRGVARLVGMEVPGVPISTDDTVALLERSWGAHDLYFLHFKDTDTKGHDGDFDGKVAAIEEVDALIPRVVELGPSVIVVTGDHSTPAVYKEHSWHHVPVLLWSEWPRPTAREFGESTCLGGDLGLIHATDLIPLALAHAGRLVKYGA
jgi:2,3-bisphosphoglycerate-independent phosphoglycerate mutase